MVVDSSALIAILTKEGDEPVFSAAIARASTRVVSAVNYLESRIVLSGRFGPTAALLIAEFVRDMNIEVVAFDRRQAEAGGDAFLRYGKGRHPAGLNFGDCVAYGLAASRGLPLLFKGNDFSKTDLKSAL